MRVLRVGLRLSLASTQRAPSLLIAAAGSYCKHPQQFAVRAVGTSRPALMKFTPPVLMPEEKAGTKSEVSKDSKSVEKSEEPKPKLTIWQKVKKEAKHYWEGTKLLGYEVKVSTKLAFKLASGRELSRREDRQLKRTLQDIVRLVPFSMFVLVPFAELLLPVALKLFPNMLPSTYETSKAKSAKSKKLGATRTHVGEYLRNSTKQKMAVPEFNSKEQQKEFEDFFRQIREGIKPDNTRLLNVARMFKDDMLLDNLSRPQLAAMAKYINIQGFGTSIILRYQIRHRMRMIKQDDRIIDYEGVDSLNAAELQSACQSRGFKTVGVSTGRLREDLNNWLQLRLHDRVPSTLLILSSAYSYGDHDLESIYDGILSVLSSLPPEVYHETELELQSDEASNAKRLEVLKEQDDLIREENQEEQDSGHVVQVRDNLNVDDDEHTPKPSTESEADVKADQVWYEKAAQEEKAREVQTKATDSEENAKADLEFYDKAKDSKSEIESPTHSEESAKADQEFYNQPKKSVPEAENPTASEENAKADQEFYDQPKKSVPEAENPTASEENAKADQEFYDQPKKSVPEAENPTASEENAKADQEFYDKAKKSQPGSESPTHSEENAKADQEFYDQAKDSKPGNEQPAKADQEFFEQPSQKETEHKDAAHMASTSSEAAVKADNDFARKS